MIRTNLLLAGDDGGYNLTKSLRIRKSASAYLSRTPASAGNRNIWTVSFWAKRGILGTSQSWYAAGTGGNIDTITLNSSDKITIDLNNTTVLTTTQVFRDPSAWYHIVFAVDTSQATASNRAKLYINGSLVTAFDTDSRSSITNNLPVTNTTVLHKYGYYDAGILYADVYYAENNFIDGQQLTPSSFGSTNALTGVWQPAKYTGTYGTNGFYLPFTNTTSTTTLGYDFSGNSNNWTTNNISLTAGTTYDSMTDVPTLTSATTANYCVMNPIDATGGSITNGNLTVTTTGSNINCRASFVIPTTGKWYFETTDVVTGGNNFVGIANSTLAISASQTGATGSIYTGMFSNAVYGFAFNFDALTYTIYKNNSVDASGSITSGIAYSIFIATSASGGASTAFNFGQQSFTYTPPTGFVALNTYNLPTSTIVKGNTVMDATTYTGNGGATQTITNTAGFKPDLVWIKDRSVARNNDLLDSIRGPTTGLFSNLTNAEVTSGYLSSFNSNGFTTGNDVSTNGSGETFVGWQWQAGQGSSSSNTSGSITSTVSVNATAGFSVVTYTGTGANATVGHGLGVAPSMYIVKSRSNGGTYYDWAVYHTGLGGNTKTLWLNLTNSVGTYPSYWNSTSPTSSVFSLGNDITVNQSSATYVAYCWAEIAGFSKFGSYTGNGSSDGPFVYTGFRPKFVLVKKSSGTSYWQVLDSTRSPYNLAGEDLFPNLSDAEATISSGTNQVDMLSNGFKIRNTNCNDSGGTYIYMAFAENPFKNALAR